MTERRDDSFESRWPEIARHVERMLAARRVPQTHREDIIQETGLRLYRTWANVDQDGPVFALSQTIAMNILRDTVRRESRRPQIEQSFNQGVERDVEREGLARLELERVRRALNDLNPAQRSVLLGEVDHRAPAVDGTPAAIKMLRLRARRNLRVMLERAGAFLGLQRLRRLLFRNEQLVASRDAAERFEQFLATGLAGVVVAVGIGVPAAIVGPVNHAQADEAPVARAAQMAPSIDIARERAFSHRAMAAAATRSVASPARSHRAARHNRNQDPTRAATTAGGELPQLPSGPTLPEPPTPPAPPCVQGMPGCGAGEKPLPEPPAPPGADIEQIVKKALRVVF